MQSKVHYDKAVWLLENQKLLPSMVSLNRIGSARATVMNNEKDYNLKLIYRYAYENKLKIYEGWMQRHIAEILLNTEDDVSEAEKCIKQAIEADKRNDMMFQLGQDYAIYAELFKREGDPSKAKENLTKAIDIYKECGADGWKEKAEKELALLS
jgi:tetratricopeptide (TPR) repeat protein